MSVKIKTLLAAMVCLWCAIAANPLQAQDSVKVTPIVSRETIELDTIIGGTEDLQFGGNVPVAGNKAMNRLLGIQTYDENFCHYFCELEMIPGRAMGFNFCYMTHRWGGYGSLLGGTQETSASQGQGAFASLGGAFRIVPQKSRLDWHLYGGLAIGNGVGFEAGTRIAGTAKGSNFSWWSGSVGLLSIAGNTYTTIGLSIAIVSTFGIILL